jgi:thiamine-phosphate pyrophosphorylase
VSHETIDWSLYAILDQSYFRGRSIVALTEAVVLGGAGVVQLRDKSGQSRTFYENAVLVKQITDEYNVPLIINDRVDITMLVDAAGVHLGQDDLPFDVARRLLGEHKILGASVHNLTELKNALPGNPDYLGVGTIYPSKTKTDLEHQGIRILKEVRQNSDLPIVAIGGITTGNLKPVIACGADGVAVITDLLDSDDVKRRAQIFVEKIELARQSNGA